MDQSISQPKPIPGSASNRVITFESRGLAAKVGGRSRIWALVAGILIFSAGLRIWGISFGLPYRYHPDEPQHVVAAARMLAEQRLEPPEFNNPPFYKYILMGADAAYVGAGFLVGKYESIGEFVQSIEVDPSPLYQLGRFVSAIAGTLTVWVTYLVGSKSLAPRIGIIAAAFLAVAFLPVRDSHFATNDSVLTLLVSVSMLGSVLIVRRGDDRSYGLAAVAGGLAFATKYTGVFTIVPLIAAHFLGSGIGSQIPRSLKVRRLVGALAIWLLSSVIGSPAFLLNPGKVIDDVGRSIYSYGRLGFAGWQVGSSSGFLFYVESLAWGIGIVLLALLVVGIVLSIFRHDSEQIVLLAFPVPLIAFMGMQDMYFARFILPAIPMMMVLAAFAAEEVTVAVLARTNLQESQGNALPLALARVVGIGMVQPTAASIQYGNLLTRLDTRTIAKAWIEENIPSGSKIAIDWPHHGPPLSTSEEPEPASSAEYDVTIVGGKGLSDHPLAWYAAEDFDYLIASSFIYEIPLLDKDADLARRGFYSSLDEDLERIQVFRPTRDGIDPPFIFDEVIGPAISIWQRIMPGPTLKIYELP